MSRKADTYEQVFAFLGTIFLEDFRRLEQDKLKLKAMCKELRSASDRLLHETQYKDHPEASQAVIDALELTKWIDL